MIFIIWIIILKRVSPISSLFSDKHLACFILGDSSEIDLVIKKDKLSTDIVLELFCKSSKGLKPNDVRGRPIYSKE